MPRPKNSSADLHVYISTAVLAWLRAEAERLEVRPGKLLSRLIAERIPTFYSRPIQLIETK